MPHAFRRHALFLGIVAVVAGAAAVSAIAPPAHHRGGRFQNNYLDFQPKGIGELIKWRIAAAREQLPRPPRLPTPRVDADLGFIRSNARPARRWCRR
jgi:hypothetical protein